MISSRCLHLYLICFALPAVFGCANAPASVPYAQPVPVVQPLSLNVQSLVDDYDHFFAASMQQSGTPGAAVAIVQDGRVVFLRGYGLKAAGGRDSVNVHTVFRIGSLSKGFAGVLTGMLVQQGLLAWDEPVQKRFPEFCLRDPKQAQRMQLRHVLSQTTGLPYHAFTNLVEDGYELRNIVANYFPKAPISAKEGTYYSYQNAAFCVIEEVMHAATGKTYPDLLMADIFDPAGMRTASCDFGTMRACDNKALPHVQTGYGWKAEAISPMYYNFAAAGGVNASIADMGEWLRLLLGARPELIADSTLDHVFRPVIKTGNERRIFPGWIDRKDASYAMGWRVLQHGADTIVYHGGYVNGFRSEIALNRNDGIGICVLFNAHTPLAKVCIPAFFERWEKNRDNSPQRTQSKPK